MRIRRILAFIFLIAGVIIMMSFVAGEKEPEGYFDRTAKYGDSTMYYDVRGTGDNTVILLSGSGVATSYTDMYGLSKDLEKDCKVIIYDRPGMGKSTGNPEKRDVDTMTSELKAVLDTAGEKGPFVIVAHSMSSVIAIRFAQEHPGSVKGIVFIDGASPEFLAGFDDPMKDQMDRMRIIRETGLLRLISLVPSVRKQLITSEVFPDNIQRASIYFTLQNLWNRNMMNERKAIKINGETVIKHGKLKGIPVTLISAGRNGFPDWDKCQEELLGISEISERVRIDESDHFIHQIYSAKVSEEIRALFERQ